LLSAEKVSDYAGNATVSEYQHILSLPASVYQKENKNRKTKFAGTSTSGKAWGVCFCKWCNCLLVYVLCIVGTVTGMIQEISFL